MKAFVTWSGSRELLIAKAVQNWLATVLPEIQSFISPDLPKGKVWFDALAKQLNDAELGFMCFAPPRVASEWQLVEAGAVWKAAGNGSLFPLCFRTPASDIPEPLRAFQLTRFEKEDFERLAADVARLAFPRRRWTADSKQAVELAWSQLNASVEDAFRRPDDGVHTTRGFIHEVAGGWWESVKAESGDTRLSWMWIEHSADGNGQTIRGDGFGASGTEVSQWQTDLVSVRAYLPEPIIDYYWEGRHPDESGLLFGGKGSLRFTISLNGGIEEARGEFNDVCLNATRKPTTKVVHLLRATKKEMLIMEGKDLNKRRALVELKARL
jgi:hypothetical protein